MRARIDDNQLPQETQMNTLPSKLGALAAALATNGLIMTGVIYLFALQAHPHMSAISLLI
jgi:mannose/fructose/N-acetylgalactosamine-specific phosphotransferase system component IID